MIEPSFDRALDLRSGRSSRVALREVDREPLVQPVRRLVVRVVDGRSRRRGGSARAGRRVSTQLVVDLGRRDQGEQRPDVRMGLAADVLPGRRPERVVERVLVGVDEEVDRRRSRSRRGASTSAATASSPIFSARSAERLVALVPSGPGRRRPSASSSRTGRRRRSWPTRRPEPGRAVGVGDPPAGGERRVRDDVAVGESSVVAERRVAGVGDVWHGLDARARPRRASDSRISTRLGTAGEVDRLLEVDRLAERRGRGRRRRTSTGSAATADAGRRARRDRQRRPRQRGDPRARPIAAPGTARSSAPTPARPCG